ncbi:MAG: class B sortase [Lachnospiraceae bacterium]|nr:class B sortase [Lachnospiraceae bacterium]
MKNPKKKVLSYLTLLICAMFSLGAVVLHLRIQRFTAQAAFEELRHEVVTARGPMIGGEDTEAEKEEEEAEDPDGWDGTGAELTVDFDRLLAENDDTIGWLHVPAVDVSYPLLYYPENNDYYLNRSFDRTYSGAGVIYLECTNDPELMDPNSLIYGHNMADGTMFGDLHHLMSDETLAEEEPYFYIYKKDGTVNRYRIFSYYQTNAGSTTYSLIESDRGYEIYTSMARELSVIDVETSFEDSPEIVTLSTCHGGAGTTRRFVVHGVHMGSARMADLPKTTVDTAGRD